MKKIFLFRTAKSIKKIITNVIKTIKYSIGILYKSEYAEFDAEQAYQVLEKQNPIPESTCIRQNKLINPPKYDIQIIVPTYNNERYLKDCIDSILNQKSEYSYKLIVIDDGSTDSTSEILNGYRKIDNIEIITTQNGGISVARNIGLSTIDASYIMFVDSDDMLPENAIDNLLNCAYENDADIVEGAHYRLYDSKLAKYNKLNNERIEDAGKLIGMPWGKVYKSTLWDNVIYPNSLWYEDTICFMILYTKAQKIYTISDYVYIYRVLNTSLSHSAYENMKSIDTVWVTKLLLKEYEDFDLDKDQEFHDKIMRQFIINQKRLKKLPITIQKASFVVTADIFKKYCYDHKCSKKYWPLNNYLNSDDFGRYKLYCENH